MKLNFTILCAAVASQDAKGDITPFLDELESYCIETYGLPAYQTRGKTRKEFADVWMNRCTKQRNKLEKVYNKVTQKGESCGTFDESYQVEFKTVPSAQNACQALSEVTAEYNRFATTFLTSDQVCGVKRRFKLKVRMEIMEKQLISKAECSPVYSTWSEYSSCTKTCGGGEELRTRECVDGTCSLATQDDVLQTQSCNTQACPPVYSTWSEYSSCTKTCGGGEELRTRECVDGTCSLATQDDVLQTQSCNAQACPPDWVYTNCEDGTWTNFMNRDAPSGNYEDESVKEFGNDGIDICNGKNATSIEARVRGTGMDYSETGQIVEINPVDGFICKNTDQTNQKCLDYEVRFCCPSSKSAIVWETRIGYFKGYPASFGYNRFSSYQEALDKCLQLKDCGGISGKYECRTWQFVQGDTTVVNPGISYAKPKDLLQTQSCNEQACWDMQIGYFSGYPASIGKNSFSSYQEAYDKCVQFEDCGGITTTHSGSPKYECRGWRFFPKDLYAIKVPGISYAKPTNFHSGQ